MRRLALLCFAVALSMAGTLGPSSGADEPSFTRREDVIYGRKFGTALTLDVFRPLKEANGLGVIFVVSGGWVLVARRDQHGVRHARSPTGGTPSSPSSTAASRGSRSPRSSAT